MDFWENSEFCPAELDASHSAIHSTHARWNGFATRTFVECEEDQIMYSVDDLIHIAETLADNYVRFPGHLERVGLVIEVISALYVDSD